MRVSWLAITMEALPWVPEYLRDIGLKIMFRRVSEEHVISGGFFFFNENLPKIGANQPKPIRAFRLIISRKVKKHVNGSFSGGVTSH